MSNTSEMERFDEYWSALLEDNEHGIQRIRAASRNDPELNALGLLDELNAARLVLHEDSTIANVDAPTPGGLGPEMPAAGEDGALGVGTSINGYLLTRLVGRGGMAVVYAARQVALSRQVALKLIRSGPLATAEDRSRFQAEVTATASLQHPGIVSVIDTGVWRGYHYFSMELIDGPTLGTILRNDPLEPSRAATYLRAIASAVQHAHNNGVLHRDPKAIQYHVESEGGHSVRDGFWFSEALC